MPLHTQKKGPTLSFLPFNALYRAIVREGIHPQSLSRLLYRLVMGGTHDAPAGSQDFVQQAAFYHPQSMRLIPAIMRPMNGIAGTTQVLDQFSAEKAIDQLHTPANG